MANPNGCLSFTLIHPHVFVTRALTRVFRRAHVNCLTHSVSRTPIFYREELDVTYNHLGISSVRPRVFGPNLSCEIRLPRVTWQLSKSWPSEANSLRKEFRWGRAIRVCPTAGSAHDFPFSFNIPIVDGLQIGGLCESGPPPNLQTTTTSVWIKDKNGRFCQTLSQI